MGRGRLADALCLWTLENGACATLLTLPGADARGRVLEPAAVSKAVCPRCDREMDTVEMMLDEQERWRCARCLEDQRVTRQEASER